MDRVIFQENIKADNAVDFDRMKARAEKAEAERDAAVQSEARVRERLKKVKEIWNGLEKKAETQTCPGCGESSDEPHGEDCWLDYFRPVLEEEGERPSPLVEIAKAHREVVEGARKPWFDENTNRPYCRICGRLQFFDPDIHVPGCALATLEKLEGRS